MLRRSVLELSSRLSTKRYPRNLGAQRFHLRKASTSGKNGANPVGKPDASKVSSPAGKPDGSKGSSSTVVIGGAVIAGAFLVAYQTGYLDQYLGNEQQKLHEPVAGKLEESHHLNVAPGVEDSTELNSLTQPQVPHSEASVGMQSDIQVQQSESNSTPERYTHISSNQEETPQGSAVDRAEKRLPIPSDDDSTSEDLITKSDTFPEIISEAENVRLEAVPQTEESTVVSAQPCSVHKETEMESASPKDSATEKAHEADIEREVEKPGSLLQEYNIEGSGTESTGSPSSGKQLTKETEALPKSTEG